MPGPLVRRPLVVVVDDTPAVRDLIARILTLEGNEVVTAPDGVVAATLIERLPETPALVITDLRMPAMGGQALGEWVKTHYPEVSLLFISGYAAEHAAELPGAFLPKPFTNDALVGAVHAALSAHNHTPADLEA